MKELDMEKVRIEKQVSRWIKVALATLAVGAAASGCKSYGSASNALPATSDTVQATLGAQGGVITGAAGTALQGVKVVIPPGALASDTVIEIKPADAETPLPANSLRVGPQIDIGPSGMELAVPAQVTLPFDENISAANDRFDDEVSVQSVSGGEKKQVDSDVGSVTVDLSTLDRVAASVSLPGPSDRVQFDLHINPKELTCVAQFPTDAQRQPKVTATVVRGNLNDSLTLRGRNLKPGLRFELFTTERSTLKADGTVDATIPNVGLAWYQSDLEVNDEGSLRANLRTIFLDQIFGVDQATTLPPTNAFHLGFWFDDPQNAVNCGFNPQNTTPFNGEHKAGPLAMITVPDATTTLGPLCTHPDTSTRPARCGP
jgi:hypothetical protein